MTGLIYDTSSFQNINTTPKSLTVAAQLVAFGGRQQEIIKNLYKTKALSTLKLWGIILSQVKEDSSHKFLWSSVSHEDLVKVGADESALSGVVDELLKSATDVDFVLLLSERQNQVHGSLRAIAKGVNVAEIAESFSGGGHEVAAAFRYDGSLKESEAKILDKIRQLRAKSSDGKETPEPPKEESKIVEHEDKTEGGVETEIEKEAVKEVQEAPEMPTEDLPSVAGQQEEKEKEEEPQEKPLTPPLISSSEPLDLTAELTESKTEIAPEMSKDQDRPKTKW